MRWSSSIALIGAVRPSSARARDAPSKSRPSGSGPISANGGQSSSASVGTRSSEPKRRGSLSASRRPSSVSISTWSCVPISAGSIRQRPDMPRWKTNVSPRSVSISPYLARRPSPVTRAPVSRWPKVGRERRGAGPARRGSIDAIRLPSSTGARPRTVVSTSGSSGMTSAIWRRAHLHAPLLERARRWTRSLSAMRRSRPEEKTRRVGGVFSSVAARYDLMNDLMSGGQHRLWKDTLRAPGAPREGRGDPRHGRRHRRHRLPPGARAARAVTVADINPEMLAVGMERARKRGIEGLVWAEENAETLSFADDSFDAYTIAFGIRNVTDIPAALREAHRVLKPAGASTASNSRRRAGRASPTLYETYSRRIVPADRQGGGEGRGQLSLSDRIDRALPRHAERSAR